MNYFSNPCVPARVRGIIFLNTLLDAMELPDPSECIPILRVFKSKEYLHCRFILNKIVVWIKKEIIQTVAVSQIATYLAFYLLFYKFATN
jgi:hypothetical protein